MDILYYAAFSVIVSVGAGLMLRARPLVAVVGALLGGLSYCVFLLCDSVKLGYFAGAFILALLSEIIAKILKTPATLFIIIGIYSLVPGMGIYEVFAHVLTGNYTEVLKMGSQTFIYLALIATAIALVSIIFGKTSEQLTKNQR